RAAYDVAFAAISQFADRLGKRNPECPLDLNSHVGLEFIDVAGLILQQIEADNLEHALLVAPRAYVDILDVRQLGDQGGSYAGLFLDLAECGFLGLFPWVNQAFGKGQSDLLGQLLCAGGGAGRLLLWLDNRQFPALASPPHHHPACGDLSNHASQIIRITGVSHWPETRGVTCPW